MNVEIINNALFINSKKIDLLFPIEKYLIVDKIIIVMLEPPLKMEYNENIYALNEDGIVLWQIEPRDYLKPNSCYLNIVNIGNGFIQANGWDSVIVKINTLDGKITSEEWVK